MPNIPLLIILLLCSAFFSATETSLFSLSRIRVKRLQAEGVKNSKLVSNLLDRPRRLIISILIGNMLVNILASSTTSSLFIRVFGEKGIGLSIVIMTLLILTFGEIIPKVIAIRNSEKIALRVAPYINIFSAIIAPIRGALYHLIVNIIAPVFTRVIPPHRHALTADEVAKAVEIGRSEGVLNVREEEMIKRVFRFTDKTAKDVMVAPQRIIAADIQTPLTEIRSIITKKKVSRMPVFEGQPGNIAGILYTKDLIAAGMRGVFTLKEILRKPFYVNETIRLDDLLREFRAHGIHMALVKNTSGNFTGLVTLQDLLEEIIGEIRDIKAAA